ncbi:MAG TPA: EamA family transporter, partial [Burkholderiales bacterium]|nr:EamA family transporter [Burkholderiales bacterium]
MTDSVAGSAAAQRPGLSPLILACLAATWLIWGSTYLAIKWALISLPPFFQMGTRFLAAGALLMAWMRLARKASWPTRAQWRNALWVGTLMLGGGMGGTAYAEQSVESGLVVAFIPVVPIMIAAINMLWKVYPSRLEATGIVVGLIGVLMLTQGAGFRASPQGLVAIAVACLSWSAGSVLSQRRWTLAPGAAGFASEMLCGGCALMLMSLAAGEPAAVASNWPFHAKAVLAWAYLVVFGSLLAFNAYMVLLARVSGGLASSYTFVNPVIA